MTDNEEIICDLCNLECVGPVCYAHKPFIFRFYHHKQYEKVLEILTNDYKSLKEELQDSVEEDILQDEEEVSEEDPYNVNQDSEENEEIQYVSEMDENDKKYDTSSNPAEDYEDLKDFIEDDGNDKKGLDQEEEEIINSLSDSTVTIVAADTKTLIGKTLDLTMAAGVGIMAGVVALSSGTENPLSTISKVSLTNFSSTDKILQTIVGGVLATIGMFSGMKEIMNAAAETDPKLPECTHCGKPENDIGCIPFCENCGKCEKEECWKDGKKMRHCLKICNDCVTNCVLCEVNVATVKRHHKAFERNMHGKLSASLYGTCKNARIVGSSLFIAGIISCLLPGIGLTLGIPMIAGSVIANSGIRIIARPVVKIKCDSCHLEDEPEFFMKSVGCQKWCQCCGVQNTGISDERFCLAMCEECSDD